MKVSFIAPPYLRYYSAVTDFHLVPAHHVTHFGYEIQNFWVQMSARGDYVIVDNGVTERGYAMNAAELVTIAHDISANCIVIPDTFDDAEKTNSEMQTNIDSILHLLPPDYAPDLMAVVHGKTEDEWIESYKLVSSNQAVRIIGLPKVMERNFESRTSFLRRIEEQGLIDHQHGRRHHLLGVWSTPDDIVTTAMQLDWVDSIDTSVPVMLGINGVTMTPHSNKISLNEATFADPHPETTLQNMAAFMRIMNYSPGGY